MLRKNGNNITNARVYNVEQLNDNLERTSNAFPLADRNLYFTHLTVHIN